MTSLTAEQLSLLLVEPSEMQRKVITRHLAAAGICSIQNANSLTDAKEKLSSFQPDLVLCAMYFEDGEGIELLHFIHQHNSLSDSLFMLVSSEHKREQLETFRQAGCLAILPKPFTSQHLQRAINASLDLIEPSQFFLEALDTEDIRVLLVDDSTMSRQYLRRVFESIGITNIVEASNGREGIEALEHYSFDLICTDYHMPEMDGRELATIIRQQTALQHIPILMVSARADELQLAQIELAGINALTDKPFEPQVLRQTLKNLLDC